MDDRLDQPEFTPQDSALLSELTKQREAASCTFSKAHLSVLMLMSSLYLFWMCWTSELESEPAKAGLSLILCLAPLLFLGRTRTIPRVVASAYPIISDFVHIYLAVRQPAESRCVHVLAGYVHHIMCVMECSMNSTEAYVSIGIHFISWIGAAIYAQVNVGGACEAVSLLGVALMTSVCISHRLQYQQKFLMRHLKLKRKEQNTQNLLNKISENIAVLDLDCKLLMMNRGFASTLDGGDFTTVARNIIVNDRTGWSMLEETEEFIYQNKESIKFRATTNRIVYSCSLYKVNWEGEFCVAFVSQDITHSLKLERACSKSKGVSATLRSVTHEIKTPVNYLMHSFRSISQLETTLSERSQDTIRRSQLVAEYLIFCVSDIIDYTNAKTNRLSVNNTLCNIYDVFNQVEAILMALCSDKQEVTTSIRTLGSSYIFLDCTKFKQVLLNVASNCLRYENSIKIEATMNEHELAVFVTALGVHIDIDVLDDPDQGSVNEGVAIRFEMIKDLLSALGGTQLSFTQSEEGSMLHFTLRIEEGSEDSDSYSVPDECVNLFGKSPEFEAMVVDDNALGLQIMKEKLEAAGVKSETAINGQDCIDKLLELESCGVHLKVIILDIQMPVLDGWQCAKKLNELYESDQLTALPFILGYSAFSSTEEIEKCMECGMHDVIPKPAPNPDLFAKLSGIFNRKLTS